MTDIQQARDVLAKWREQTTVSPWEASDGSIWGVAEGGDEMGAGISDADARLIVGTAGNPELLDAMDGALHLYRRMPEGSIPTFIKRIAAAIVAADERMSA